MIGNIIIIAIAVCLICYVVKVFGSELRRKTSFHLSGIIAALILVFSIFVPNIDFIKSPFTPQIHGKVIDAETNKPMKDVIIIASWGYSYGEFPMHSYGAFTKQLLVKTDHNGEFTIGRRLRYLAFNLFPLYNKDSGGVMAFILYKDYKYTGIKAIDSYQPIYLTKLNTMQEKTSEYSQLTSLSHIITKLYRGETKEYLQATVDNRLRQLYAEGAWR